MIVLIVLEIAIAVALPLWSGAAQRDNEEEMIFRGLQYAEAVRVFQQLNGRLPASVKELAENEPRVLRRAWTNPVDPDAGWMPVLQPEGLQEVGAGGQAGGQQLGGRPGLSGPGASGTGASGTGQGNQQQRQGGLQQALQRRQESNQQPPGRQQASGRDRSRSRERRLGKREETEVQPFLGGDLDDLEETTFGAFFGVKPAVEGDAILTFFGGESYADWEFRPEMLVQPPNEEGRIPVPRLWSQRFWVPVPGAGEIAEGEGPSEMGDDEGDRRGRRSMFDQRDE